MLVVCQVTMDRRESSPLVNEKSDACRGHLIKSDFPLEIEDFTENKTINFLKIGRHEVRPIGRLKILEKTPPENYFGGTKEKKKVKKKAKRKRGLGLSQVAEGRPRTPPKEEEESLTEEEIIERKLLQLKIMKNLKEKEFRERQIYLRQRQAEENYIRQQEDLAETWLRFLEERKKKFNSKDS